MGRERAARALDDQEVRIRRRRRHLARHLAAHDAEGMSDSATRRRRLQEAAGLGRAGSHLPLNRVGVEILPHARADADLTHERQRARAQQVHVLDEEADELGAEPLGDLGRRLERFRRARGGVEGDDDAPDVERRGLAVHGRGSGGVESGTSVACAALSARSGRANLRAASASSASRASTRWLMVPSG